MITLHKEEQTQNVWNGHDECCYLNENNLHILVLLYANYFYRVQTNKYD